MRLSPGLPARHFPVCARIRRYTRPTEMTGQLAVAPGQRGAAGGVADTPDSPQFRLETRGKESASYFLSLIQPFAYRTPALKRCLNGFKRSSRALAVSALST
jgi:hypothetical protein